MEFNARPFNPIFRSNAESSPLPKFSYTHMRYQECNELEQDAIDCMNAYGVKRGSKLCESYLLDYKECTMQLMQRSRTNLMRRERLKQILRGERKLIDCFDPIKVPRDAFQTGPFYN